MAEDGCDVQDRLHMTSREYRPEIDGLRALAVLPVVFFHLGFEWIRGGFLGVDVFFVISGFLITSIVLSDIRSGRFTFREFWARRIRRIFPPLIVMIGCTLLAAWFYMPTFDHPAIGKQAVAAMLSVANVFFWRSAGDYWGLQAEQFPLLHTWSLSVEEQFYLLLPLAIWLVCRWRPRLLTRSLVFLAVGSFMLFLWGSQRSPAATFYLLPTRAWELAVGCTLAAAFGACDRGRSESPAWHSWLAIAGLGMILATYFLLPKMTAGVAVTVIGAALVLCFGGSGACRVILSLPPLVYIGKASYSLYLWHWPFLVFAGHPNVLGNPLLYCGLSCVAGVASYECIEKPTRRRSGILPAIGGSYIAVLAIACCMVYSTGDYDTSLFNRPASHSYSFDLGDTDRSAYLRVVARAGRTHDLPPPEFDGNAFREGGIIVGEDRPPRVVVLGDSHGAMWSHVICKAATKLAVTTAFYSAIGVPPFVTFPLKPQLPKPGVFDTMAFNASRLGFIEQWHPDVVVVCARWSNYEHKDAVDLFEFLERHAARILLIEQPPELSIADRSVIEWLGFKRVAPHSGRKVWLPEGNRKRYERGRTLIRQLAREFPKCTVVPSKDLYSRQSEVLVQPEVVVLDGKDIVYLDDDHLTDFGSEIAGKRIEEALARGLSEGQTPVYATP